MLTTPELTPADLVHPDWPAPPRVRAIVTTRDGGVSAPPFGRWQPGPDGGGIDLPGGLNLGRLCGDDAAHVDENRRRLLAFAGVPAAWLHQVHGADVVDAQHAFDVVRDGGAPLRADASVTDRAGLACVVMIADCMPVLLCDAAGRAVGAAHAGWRGLASGVIERTAQRVAELAGVCTGELHAYLGPSIGPTTFEVGEDVRDAFLDDPTAADDARREAIASAFVARAGAPGKYLADLPALARVRLASIGVRSIAGGDLCTVTQRERFYSYRRDRETGRMAALIWLVP
ncbi:MAG TPA: peptidoglycan editing factor PgeF [Paraburkholderia sp.]|nr:peptidoglycan editing factor PgeF [Paraburkholderia sp.]